jgi:hypothetical protein
MGKVLINPTDKGNVALFTPCEGVEITEELAKKIVPNGVPYKIIDDSLVPEDHTFFDAWEADFSEPDGYGGEEGFNG